MPTYDYECDACQHTWELFQNITADPVKKCPECGKKKARRLFGTGAALMFKGSGFYETDYRSDSYKKSAKADSSSSEGATKDSGNSDKGSGAAESKTESKPSKTSDAKSSSASKSKKPGNDRKS